MVTQTIAMLISHLLKITINTTKITLTEIVHQSTQNYSKLDQITKIITHIKTIHHLQTIKEVLIT